MMVNRRTRPICHLASLDQFILSPAVGEAALQSKSIAPTIRNPVCRQFRQFGQCLTAPTPPGGI
jgi:hypothetical protein